LPKNTLTAFANLPKKAKSQNKKVFKFVTFTKKNGAKKRGALRRSSLLG
jgi:hypothetical protein